MNIAASRHANTGRIINNVKSWHRGVAVDVEGMSIDEQLVAAKLDWSVNIGPFRYGPELQYTDDKVKVAYREDTGMYIDTYTSRKPWQNRTIVEHFHEFCANSDLGLKVKFLGALEDGKSLFAGAYLPTKTDVLGQGDYTEWLLLLKDSHMNGRGLQVCLYGNRLVCTNGMQSPVRVNNQVIAHVGELSRDRVNELLEAALQNVREKEQTYNKLAQVQMTQKEAHLQLIHAFGDPEKELDEQPRPVKVALELFAGKADGAEYLSAYKTAYGLLQSVTQYYTWEAADRGTSASQLHSIINGSRGQSMNKFERQLVSTCLK